MPTLSDDRTNNMTYQDFNFYLRSIEKHLEQYPVWDGMDEAERWNNQENRKKLNKMALQVIERYYSQFKKEQV